MNSATVKPIALMRYLVRLVTPVGGTVLDFFHGLCLCLRAARLHHHRARGLDAAQPVLKTIPATEGSVN